MEEKIAQEISSPSPQVIQPDVQNPPVNSRKAKPFWIIGIIIFLLIIVAIAGYLLISQNKKQAMENRVYHVGIVSGLEGFYPVADGFKQGMTKLGYVEGKNIIYDIQRLNDDPAGEQRVAKKFVTDKVDLIFSFPTGPSMAAKDATKGTNIPVVFAVAGVEMNSLVNSIQSPGGNITGVRFPLNENTVKRLEILHEIAPNAKRIYLVYDVNYPNTKAALEKLRSAAPTLGLTLVEDPVKNIEELKAAIKVRNSGNIGVDAVLIMPDILNHSDGLTEIIAFANKHKLPVGGCMSNTADVGAIFSFFPDSINQGMLAAASANKIFKGTSAGTIPVITPENYLRINNKVIQQLGLSASEKLLTQASEIIR
jgi:putative tryptophan/tyrosine transport system substrate-binding protein